MAPVSFPHAKLWDMQSCPYLLCSEDRSFHGGLSSADCSIGSWDWGSLSLKKMCYIFREYCEACSQLLPWFALCGGREPKVRKQLSDLTRKAGMSVCSVSIGNICLRHIKSSPGFFFVGFVFIILAQIWDYFYFMVIWFVWFVIWGFDA